MAGTAVAETFIPPSSSNIAAFTWDPETDTLTVEFVNGDEYAYFNVPQSIYSGWTANGGSGGWFHRHIKGKYPYEKQ